MALSQNKWCSVVTRPQCHLDLFFLKMVGAISVWPELPFKTKSTRRRKTETVRLHTLERSGLGFWNVFSKRTSFLE